MECVSYSTLSTEKKSKLQCYNGHIYLLQIKLNTGMCFTLVLYPCKVYIYRLWYIHTAHESMTLVFVYVHSKGSYVIGHFIATERQTRKIT